MHHARNLSNQIHPLEIHYLLHMQHFDMHSFAPHHVVKLLLIKGFQNLRESSITNFAAMRNQPIFT